MTTEIVTTTSNYPVLGDISYTDLQDLTPWDFPEIKIPGGATAFAVPGDNPEKPDNIDHLDGVVVHFHDSSILWLEEDAERPHAVSDDGINQRVTAEGVEVAKRLNLPVPGNYTATCPYHQWGSKRDLLGEGTSNAKAANAKVKLYILQPGELIPKMLALTPSSFKAWKATKLAAMNKGGVQNLVMQLTLTSHVEGKQKWSTVNFRVAGAVPEESRQVIAEMKGFVASVIARASAYEAPADSVSEDTVSEEPSTGTEALIASLDASEVL
jgi:hypothetical protein